MKKKEFEEFYKYITRLNINVINGEVAEEVKDRYRKSLRNVSSGTVMKKAVIVIRDRFTPAWEEMAKLIIEFWEPITLAIEKAMRGKPKWYKPTGHNNYCKLHHMALRRVVRCRQRRSRHRYPLGGPRAYITVFDELCECV